MMSTLMRNAVMICLMAVFCAVVIGCSSSDNGRVAELEGQLDMAEAARMTAEDQLAALRTQIETLMGRADISPEDLATLRTQVEMLMDRADISTEDLAAIQEELEEFRMAQMLRQQEEQTRRDIMAAAGLDGGLARSPQAAVYAMSEEDTIANRLPDGQTTFAPSSTALYWDWLGVQTASQPELGAAYVNSFSSDGAGGFHVTYVIDGKEHAAHFTRDQYRSSYSDYLKRLEDNNAYLWSWSGAFENEEDDHTDGSIYRNYHDMHGWEFVLGGASFRGSFTYGLRTMPENLPMGSATYEGYMIGEWWQADDAQFNRGEVYYQADLNLEANLDDGTISGRFDEFRIPAWWSTSGDSELLAGNSIDIVSIPINEARFAADWVGNGPVDAPPAKSLHGFTGRLIGEFYGPAAEEAGGVLSGQRAAMGIAGEEFITGGFSASQVAPDQ